MECMTAQVFNVLDELREHVDIMMKNAGEWPAKDNCGYSFEPDRVFSTEPLSFTEAALMLNSQTADMMRFVYSLNRHSPLFFKASSLLERMVRQMGIFCITKAVLEQQGNKLPFLDDITVDKLRRMTAFNIRKCYASFTEDGERNHFNSGLMDLSIRWNVLDRRLIATEEKIEKIKAGKVKADLSGKAEALAGEKAAKADPADDARDEAAPLAGGARALPVDKAAAAAMGKQETDPEADGAPMQTEAGAPEAPAEAEAPEAADEYLPGGADPGGDDHGDYKDGNDPDEADEPDYSEFFSRFFTKANLPNVAERAIRGYVEGQYTAVGPP